MVMDTIDCIALPIWSYFHFRKEIIKKMTGFKIVQIFQRAFRTAKQLEALKVSVKYIFTYVQQVLIAFQFPLVSQQLVGGRDLPTAAHIQLAVVLMNDHDAT